MFASISYMLAKVFWKLHTCPSENHPPVDRIDSKLAIDAVLHAIKFVPEKRDSRHSDKDPILEPHYKLVSMLHKLVRSRRPESVRSSLHVYVENATLTVSDHEC